MRRWLTAFVLLLAGLLVGGVAGVSLLRGQTPGATPIPKELTSYRDVVKKVLPAVVSIEGKTAATTVKAKQPSKRTLPNDQQIPEEFRRFFRDFGDMPSGPDMDQAPHLGFGSGFLVDPTGVVLTNNHVVAGASEVVVTLQDGRKFTSKTIKTDPMTDLAIVRLDAGKESLPYLTLGDSAAMEIGDRVLAVGAPFRMRGTVTCGIVSSKGRSMGMNAYEDFLQTDAAINPGNSGGPLVNLRGEVVGINSAIKSVSGGWQGIGLAVSSNLAKNVMEQLEKTGEVHRGYLGVHIQTLKGGDLAARLGAPKEGGVLVSEVEEKGPGAKAGLKEGDVITTLNGQPVHDGQELRMDIASLAPGKQVEVAIVRDGKPETLKATIEEQPKDFANMERQQESQAPRGRSRNRGTAVTVDKIGVEVSDLTQAQAERLGFRDNAGALVSKVEENGVASEGGLEKGMLVRKVDRKPVKSAAEFKEAVEKGSLDKGLLLQEESPEGGMSFLLLKQAAPATK
jgi:serine protease Do